MLPVGFASKAYLEEFIASMPAEYVSSFHPTAVAAHAAVAAARGARPILAGHFASERDVAEGLCVVAADRPGLLAAISAALVTTSLDVVHAEAYTRRTPARQAEAVDLFWVRRADRSDNARLDAGTLADLNATLLRAYAGHLDIAAAPTRRASTQFFETRVRFIENADGGLANLEVETGDRPGLLLALARALFEQRVQIVGSAVHTDDSGRVRDRFALQELDGRAIAGDRRLTIQVAILTAVDSPEAGTHSPPPERAGAAT